MWRFNSKYDPEWVPRYATLDYLDQAVTQGVAMADAEGVGELPIIGRFLGKST